MLLVYGALGVKLARSLSILDFRILAVFKIKRFWDKKDPPSEGRFCDLNEFTGHRGRATLPCCRMKNHAARTRQWY
jgi:hypothetical protein